MQKEIREIWQKLKTAATPEGKAATRKFVPDAEGVYGVRMPFLNELAREYRKGGFELVETLWEAGAYEERILAAKLLGKLCKKDPQKALALVTRFSSGISNWAVCDALGMQALKPAAPLIREEIFQLAEKLVGSDNSWERRYSLVLVEVFTKDPTAHSRIMKLVRTLEKDEAYYVKKAVEWIKRNLQVGR